MVVSHYIQQMRNNPGFQIEIEDYTLSIGIGNTHYCDNHGEGVEGRADEAHVMKKWKPLSERAACTSTMEVAILGKSGNFVALPNNVSAYVPVSNLAYLIVAIEAHDWERVCLLCDEEVDEDKFPQKT
jgi:deoxycytidine triphosphate deaminase